MVTHFLFFELFILLDETLSYFFIYMKVQRKNWIGALDTRWLLEQLRVSSICMSGAKGASSIETSKLQIYYLRKILNLRYEFEFGILDFFIKKNTRNTHPDVIHNFPLV